MFGVVIYLGIIQFTHSANKLESCEAELIARGLLDPDTEYLTTFDVASGSLIQQGDSSMSTASEWSWPIDITDVENLQLLILKIIYAFDIEHTGFSTAVGQRNTSYEMTSAGRTASPENYLPSDTRFRDKLAEIRAFDPSKHVSKRTVPHEERLASLAFKNLDDFLPFDHAAGTIAHQRLVRIDATFLNNSFVELYISRRSNKYYLNLRNISGNLESLFIDFFRERERRNVGNMELLDRLCTLTGRTPLVTVASLDRQLRPRQGGFELEALENLVQRLLGLISEFDNGEISAETINPFAAVIQEFRSHESFLNILIDRIPLIARQIIYDMSQSVHNSDITDDWRVTKLRYATAQAEYFVTDARARSKLFESSNIEDILATVSDLADDKGREILLKYAKAIMFQIRAQSMITEMRGGLTITIPDLKLPVAKIVTDLGEYLLYLDFTLKTELTLDYDESALRLYYKHGPSDASLFPDKHLSSIHNVGLSLRIVSSATNELQQVTLDHGDSMQQLEAHALLKLLNNQFSID